MPWILPGSRVLDIGASQAELFQRAGSKIAPSTGLEPSLSETFHWGMHTILAQEFPCSLLKNEDFDAITMLAVMEHLKPQVLESLEEECYRLLRPRGRIILTVPSPWVDFILIGLRFLRLIDGMSLEQHHGFRPSQVEQILSTTRFRLIRRGRFQLGLNNLFVFEKQ